MKSFAEGVVMGLVAAGSLGVAQELTSDKPLMFWFAFVFFMFVGFICVKIVGGKI